MKKVPPELDKIVDKVLAYRPKPNKKTAKGAMEYLTESDLALLFMVLKFRIDFYEDRKVQQDIIDRQKVCLENLKKEIDKCRNYDGTIYEVRP